MKVLLHFCISSVPDVSEPCSRFLSWEAKYTFSYVWFMSHSTHPRAHSSFTSFTPIRLFLCNVCSALTRPRAQRGYSDYDTLHVINLPSLIMIFHHSFLIHVWSMSDPCLIHVWSKQYTAPFILHLTYFYSSFTTQRLIGANAPPSAARLFRLWYSSRHLF